LICFEKCGKKSILLSLGERLPLEHKKGRYHHLAGPEEGSIGIVKDKSLP